MASRLTIDVRSENGNGSNGVGRTVFAVTQHENHRACRINVADAVTYQNPAILDSGQVVIANEEELRLLLANAQKIKAAVE